MPEFAGEKQESDGGTATASSSDEDSPERERDSRVEDILNGEYITFEEHNEKRQEQQ